MPPTQGYDPSFLAVHVALPAPARPATGRPVEVLRLAYTHFTVVLRPDRRLAAVTAVNVDGALLRDVDRAGIDWRLDERVAAHDQVGEEVYAGNQLDRGHLVRRRDPVWGTAEIAAAANTDTFFYTNAAPQVAVFNQSKDLWLGLEDHVLSQATRTGSRLSVLTGPVLAADDPLYRGVQLPRRFWKVVAWVRPDGLAATGYLLDQGALLDALLARERARIPQGTAPADLGAYRTFQVQLTEIARAAGVDLGALVAADRLTAAAAPRTQAVRRIELTLFEQVVL